MKCKPLLFIKFVVNMCDEITKALIRAATQKFLLGNLFMILIDRLSLLDTLRPMLTRCKVHASEMKACCSRKAFLQEWFGEKKESRRQTVISSEFIKKILK